MFLQYVEKIAVVDQMERRNSLMEILREEDIPFVHFRQRNHENWVENIVVSINPSSRRTVIGAHYDSVENSTGANDNAAGVSVLIHLAKKLLVQTDISVDIVFFDREEYANRGSEKYIISTGKENIATMINLDICGYGDAIAVYAKNNENIDGFGKLFDSAVLQENAARVVNYLPSGDDTAFDGESIPNISIAVLPKQDIEQFEYIYANYLKLQVIPPEEERNELLAKIEVMSTMHNGMNDTISSVSEASMEMLFRYLCAGLELP